MHVHFMQLTSAIAKRPSKVRSAVSNGKRSFVDGDGKSVWARRQRDLFELHISDLGPVESLSEAQLSICRRVATIEVELERQEGALSKGEAIDLDAYSRIAGNLRRMLESIGIERAKRDLTPDLATYLASKARLQAAE
jgi:hypothetical protein